VTEFGVVSGNKICEMLDSRLSKHIAEDGMFLVFVKLTCSANCVLLVSSNSLLACVIYLMNIVQDVGAQRKVNVRKQQVFLVLILVVNQKIAVLSM